MTPKQVEKELARLEREYYKGLHALTSRVRKENVIPYVRRTGLEFTAGMGSWFFGHGDKVQASSHYAHPDGRFPKRLYAILDARDIRGQDIGSQTQDYGRK
jgi:hypothetical protein